MKKNKDKQVIKCSVESCEYQDCKDNCCTLNEIEVGCSCCEPSEKDETACKSFKCCENKEEE